MKSLAGIATQNLQSFDLVRMLDALADNKTLLEAYQEIYRHYQAEKKQLTELVQSIQPD